MIGGERTWGSVNRDRQHLVTQDFEFVLGVESALEGAEDAGVPSESRVERRESCKVSFPSDSFKAMKANQGSLTQYSVRATFGGMQAVELYPHRWAIFPLSGNEIVDVSFTDETGKFVVMLDVRTLVSVQPQAIEPLG